MRFSAPLIIYNILQVATVAFASCAANNCIRALVATTRQGDADCSSYLAVTIHSSTTITPTGMPAYASPCTNFAEYSSACSCIGITRKTTAVGTTSSISSSKLPISTSSSKLIPSSSTSKTLSSTSSTSSSSLSSSSSTVSSTITIDTSSSISTTSTFVSRSINTALGYVIVSPTSCPPSAPTGSLIGTSNSNFSQQYNGLQYQQYPNSQLIIQNNATGPIFVDLSSNSSVTMSDGAGDTLILYANGTFQAFAGNCELEIVGSWLSPNGTSPTNGTVLSRRDGLALHSRQSSELCDAAQAYCNSQLGTFINGVAGAVICGALGAEIGADVGGAIGFLGNILGPEVGIPTTLLGVVLGGRLGAFLAGKIGQALCGGATSLLGDALCKACPPTCPAGQIRCHGGPCLDFLSDPNNCGGCGITCPSGICQNAQCSAPTCDGSVCGSLNGCDAGCFCFEDANSIGFCGPNVPCAPLAGCGVNSDCASGEVCAVGTCCGVNVCLGSCTVVARRSALSLIGNTTELFTGGPGGLPYL